MPGDGLMGKVSREARADGYAEGDLQLEAGELGISRRGSRW